MAKMKQPTLVAHRGHAEHCPENSKSAFLDAIQIGASAIEFDIQLTQDKHPIVLHDETLERTTNFSGSVFDHKLSDLKSCSAHEPKRFHDQFYFEPLLSVEELGEIMQHHPDCEVFAEIKPESIARFDLKTVVDGTLKALNKLSKQTIIISMDADAVRYAKSVSDFRCGWVMHRWQPQGQRIMEELAVEFLYCDYLSIPNIAQDLWPGDWQWALYEVTEPELGIQLFNLGANYIETKRIAYFMQDARFNPKLKDSGER